MIEVLVGLFALVAGVFAFIAAVGIMRFPDALARMHASSKVGTLAASASLVAAALHIGDMSAASRAVLAILFLLLTAPIGAHLLGRAAAWRMHRISKRSKIAPSELKR